MRFSFSYLKRNLGAIAMAAAVAACDAGRLTNPPDAQPPASEPSGATAASIVLSPGIVDMAVGDIVRLSAEAYDQNGQLIQGRDIQWSSASAGTRTKISSDGTLEGVQVGEDTIFASMDGRAGKAALRIFVPKVAAVIVSLSATTLQVGRTAQATAVMYDQKGAPIQANVFWTSTATSVATIDQSGRITPKAPGTTKIKAVSEGKVDTEVLTVVPSTAGVPATVVATSPASVLYVGKHLQLSATVRDADGALVQNAAVTWTSSAPTIASVSSSGDATGLASGTAVFKATVAGKSGETTVSVANAPVNALTLALQPSNIVLPSTIPSSQAGIVAEPTSLAVATAYDADGTILIGRTVAYVSSDPGVAAVSSTGVVTGLAPGSASITATSEGKTATAAITVNAAPLAPVASLSVVLNSPSLQVGAATQALATPLDASGQPLSGRSVSWSSTNSSVASVNSAGLVTAVSPGTASIRATSEGKTGTAQVTVVQAVTLTSVEISPSSATLNVGESRTYSALGRNSDGSSVSVYVTWSATGGNITQQGNYTAGQVAGSFLVIAACACGVSDTSALEVLAPAAAPAPTIAALTVAPTTMNLNTGASHQFVANGWLAGSSTPISTPVIWSATGGTVDQAGMYVAGSSTGTFVVRAQSTTVTWRKDSAVVTITAPTAPPAPTVSAFSLTPASASIQVSSTVQLQTSATWSDGQAHPYAVAYSGTGGTISTSGLYTAGTVSGTFRAIATCDCGKADTSVITVTAPPPPPSSDPIAALTVAPHTTTLAAGEAFTFVANGWLAGASTPIATPVVWSATGGSVDQSGRYVAGSVAGTYVVRAQSTLITWRTDSAIVTITPPAPVADVNECSVPRAGWLWCDDFEQNRLSSYFEYDNASGKFARTAAIGHGSSWGMRAQFGVGATSVGSLKVAFGKTPQAYFRAVDAGTANYREVYWRMYLRNAPGWTGGGGEKLSRATIFASSTSWAEAMIAHVWSGSTSATRDYLMIDPASGTDAAGVLKTTSYNDFANLRWLGNAQGVTPIFNAANVGSWQCIETRVRLNDAGQSNGAFQLWVNGALEASKTNLNWVGNFSAYGLNSIFLENFWNAGSPAAQERYLDRLVVSTQPIGCDDSAAPPPSAPPAVPPPTPPPAPPVTPTVTSFSLTPSTTSLLTLGVVQLQTSTVWSDGVSRSVGVTYSATGGTVSLGGLYVAGILAGNFRVIATCDCGRSDTTTVTITLPLAPPPPPPAGSVQPLVSEDFSTYTSTSNMMSDPRQLYSSGEVTRPEQMTLDQTVGYGASTKSLRYDFPDRTAEGGSGTSGRCTSYTITRKIRFPSQTPREAWAELYVRFSSNFVIGAPAEWGCTSGKDYKFIIGAIAGTGRFHLDQSYQWTVAYPSIPGGEVGVQNPPMTPADVRSDGQWHRYRFHYKMSSVDGIPDGAFEVWMDNVKIWERVNVNVTGANLHSIALGSNLNQGPGELQSVWWGKITIWGTNPGW